jgi:GTPase SAR1 family protein
VQRSALTKRPRQCLVRGDIGTGKSALLKRLRGGGFTPSYEPRRVPSRAACAPAAAKPSCGHRSQPLTARLSPRSVQISTAKVAWKCASEPDDVITLEVWDVVDRCAAWPIAYYVCAL